MAEESTSKRKRYLGISVFEAAQQRIAWAFDTFPRAFVSFSGGKDSTVVTHMVADEAKRRNRRFGLVFVDFEAQYDLTIRHVREVFSMYRDIADCYWVALPMELRNAVSVFETNWTCWDPTRQEDWVRPLPPEAISDPGYFPFYRPGMDFGEFMFEFGQWYGQGDEVACFVGIRAAESLNRWRTIATRDKDMKDGKPWTTYWAKTVNVYPIYDWRTQDIWTYIGKAGKPYNRIYDRMYQAGGSIHQQRLCQPYGDDQRKGLWLFHVLEPETWARVVARVNGANQGALYARESGNILGRLRITKPAGHTWESFARLILESLPPSAAEHYRNKIAVFLRWWERHGVCPIPDEVPGDLRSKEQPSWRRICKALLRNDYWCKGLSFSPTTRTKEARQRYQQLMARRRREWAEVLPEFIRGR